MVDDEQHDAQEEADGAHGDVGDAQERVLASHPGDGAQDHALLALEAADGIIWVGRVKEGNRGSRVDVRPVRHELQGKDTVDDLQRVVPALQRGNHFALLVDDAVEFAEGRQGGGSHPHDEVLVDEAVVLD